MRWVTDPADLADADVVVIPGSKATVADLAWLRERGLADGRRRARRDAAGPCSASAAASRCCAAASTTPWSQVSGDIDGLGLLDADIVFAPDKTLAHHDARRCSGYEIHHGLVARSAEDDWLGVGIRRGAVFGTHWHGLLDNDDVRRDWLPRRGAATGSSSPTTSTFPARRDAQLDLMADLLAGHTDTSAILGLLDTGPPSRQTVTTALSG